MFHAQVSLEAAITVLARRIAKSRAARNGKSAFLPAGIVLLSVFFAGSSAQADTLAYAFSISGTAQYLGLDVTSSLPSFDPAIGVLQSVTLSGSTGPLSIEGAVQNKSNMASGISGYSLVNWGLSGSSGTSLLYKSWQGSWHSGSVGPFNFDEGDSIDWNDSVPALTASSVFASNLSAFEGSHAIAVYFHESVQTEASGGNAIPAYWIGNNPLHATLNGTVTYTYTPVPEPSTLALLAACAAGLAASAWRQRTKRQ